MNNYIKFHYTKNWEREKKKSILTAVVSAVSPGVRLKDKAS